MPVDVFAFHFFSYHYSFLYIINFVTTPSSYFVPVCYNVQPNNRDDVYKVITDNSFVTSLTPEKANDLSLETRAKIVNNERNFLKNKISEKDPLAKTVFIPKSLYQLFVWNLYLKDIAKGPSQYVNPWFSSFKMEEIVDKKNPKTPDEVGFDLRKDPNGVVFDFSGLYPKLIYK